LRPQHLIAISENGYVAVFELPLVISHFFEDLLPVQAQAVAVSKSSYGTVRSAKTMRDYVPLSARNPPLICLKTTVIAELNATTFASPTILLDYSYDRLQDVGTDPEKLLPILWYRKRGSLDWSPSYEITCNTLVEQTYVANQRRILPSLKHLPSFQSDCHYLAKDWDSIRSRRRQNPSPGLLFLDTSLKEDAHPMDYRDRSHWALIDYAAGRVLLLRPRRGAVEVFDFIESA
jgi:hypothetical protein